MDPHQSKLPCLTAHSLLLALADSESGWGSCFLLLPLFSTEVLDFSPS